MAILNSELILRKSRWDAPSQNGGPMSTTAVVSGQRNNVFPDLRAADLAAGGTTLRKLFWHVAHAGVLPFIDVRVWLAQPTPGDGRVLLFGGTQRDLETDLTGTERRYGVGPLLVDSAASTLVVDGEPGAGTEAVFQAGDIIRVFGASTGEFAEVDSVSWSGDDATLTLVNPLSGTYAAGVSWVASCLTATSVAPTVTDLVTTGTVGIDGGEIAPDGLGTLEETVTLTFSSPTIFSALSDYSGGLGTGSTASDFAPSNPAYGVPRWTIPATAWTTAATAGDTVMFTVHPAGISFWLERITPAGQAPGDDGTATGIWGES